YRLYSHLLLFCLIYPLFFFFFFFNATSPTVFYTLSLHDALPILLRHFLIAGRFAGVNDVLAVGAEDLLESRHIKLLSGVDECIRSEEHTSELQSRGHLVCRLLLEKKKKNTHTRLKDFQTPKQHSV